MDSNTIIKVLNTTIEPGNGPESAAHTDKPPTANYHRIFSIVSLNLLYKCCTKRKAFKFSLEGFLDLVARRRFELPTSGL